ncbi:MAG: pyridoxamine 5'-phosphate oxidase family protein, partial [Marinomonas sp.]
MSNSDNPNESDIPQGDPVELFEAWFAQAHQSEANDPNAVALATATPAGAPSVRMVLLKGHGPSDDGGAEFTFYTNAESRKGEE